MFQAPVIVDGRGHLLGRLASVIAKELLNGQQVIVVRCEEINISGKDSRNHKNFLNFLNKRTATNPKFGPIHYRAPSQILWRTVRGMLPHKLARGTEALKKLKVFEGVPEQYQCKKAMVVPDALRIVRLRAGQKYSRLGKIARQVGWKYAPVIYKLEGVRKVKSKEFYEKKKAERKLRVKAVESLDLKEENEILVPAGF